MVFHLVERSGWPVSSWRGDDSILQESKEEQTPTAGVAAVESEGEFIETGVQMRGCNRSLMRAEQPAFEQRSNAMHPWHGNVCQIAAAGNVGHPVPVSLFEKAVITFPAVGVNL